MWFFWFVVHLLALLCGFIVGSDMACKYEAPQIQWRPAPLQQAVCDCVVLCVLCVCVCVTMKKWVQCFDHTCVEAVMVRCAPVTMRSTAKARREETCTSCPMQASTMAVNRNVSAFTTVATVPIEVPARLSAKNTDPH